MGNEISMTTDVDQTIEDPEGIEDPSSEGWGDYPLDSVFVRQETRTVLDVLKRINDDRYILDPEFQRDFIWPVEKQSKLIESCIMRIPLPVFYVAEAPDGRIIIVDGLQRITTFVRFTSNNFRLKGLTSSEDFAPEHPLEGKQFRELSLSLQERVLDTQLIMYILDSKAPERARLDIFERVNSGVPLTRQQMRNAIYNGPATHWLREAATDQLFNRVTRSSLDPKKMRDREAINRYCAFMLLSRSDYRGDMDSFLASALLEMNREPATSLDELREAFDRSMATNENLFGTQAFRKSLGEGDPNAYRTVINISLFEVCAVTFAKLPEVLDADSDGGRYVRTTLIDLIKDKNFEQAITYSTNSTRTVNARFEMMEAAFGDLMEVA